MVQMVYTSCLTSPDMIIVYDGKDSSAPIIGAFCNTKAFLEVVSTSNSLFISFVTKSHFPGQVSVLTRIVHGLDILVCVNCLVQRRDGIFPFSP